MKVSPVSLLQMFPTPPSLWALEHGSLLGGFSWQASINVLVNEAAFSLACILSVSGPLMTAAVECHLPTQAEHDW